MLGLLVVRMSLVVEINHNPSIRDIDTRGSHSDVFRRNVTRSQGVDRDESWMAQRKQMKWCE